jgi:DNA-binding IclR family transcriptional regulator
VSTSSEPLNATRLAILRAVHDCIAKTGGSPTGPEIAARVDHSASSVALHVSRLVRLGYLSKDRRKHRTIALTTAGHVAVDNAARGVR